MVRREEYIFAKRRNSNLFLNILNKKIVLNLARSRGKGLVVLCCVCVVWACSARAKREHRRARVPAGWSLAAQLPVARWGGCVFGGMRGSAACQASSNPRPPMSATRYHLPIFTTYQPPHRCGSVVEAAIDAAVAASPRPSSSYVLAELQLPPGTAEVSSSPRWILS